MIDLTKIDQPFGTLDIETKLALHRAHYEGKVIECLRTTSGKWHVTNCPQWIHDYVYRLQPEPLRDISLPWAALDDRWQWAAREKDGALWMFTDEPRAVEFYWVPSAGSSRRINNLLANFAPGNKPWNESLIRRPEGV